MKVIFLGSGSAFFIDGNYQSNLLIISDNNKKILIDCGTDIRHSLFEQGFGHSDIDAVYVSHLHSDHVGGLEWLGFCKKFHDFNIPTMYISADQVDLLWNNVLLGGMSTIANQQPRLETFFRVKKLEENAKFIWEDIEFQLVRTLHAINNKKYMPSYGLFITYKGHKIFFTADTIYDPARFESYFTSADIIFHDCETMPNHSGVHAHFDQLKDLSPGIKGKIWLYDYNLGPLPNAKAQGFLGFVTKGQIFQFS